MENLCILLTDDEVQSSATIANLPTNVDGLKALSTTTSSEDAVVSKNSYKINQLCITLWVEKNNKIQWYVEYIKDCRHICR